MAKWQYRGCRMIEVAGSNFQIDSSSEITMGCYLLSRQMSSLRGNVIGSRISYLARIQAWATSELRKWLRCRFYVLLGAIVRRGSILELSTKANVLSSSRNQIRRGSQLPSNQMSDNYGVPVRSRQFVCISLFSYDTRSRVCKGMMCLD